MFLAANAMRNKMIVGMQTTPRAPWYYYRQQGTKRHNPSMPHNYPAIDSGNLIGSIVIDNRENEVEVGSILLEPEYPEYLEEGTEKMIERPFALPTLEETPIEQIIIREIARGTGL